MMDKARLAQLLDRWKVYWTAVGVIPRYQLVLVYTLITVVFALTALWSFNAADEAKMAVRAVQNQRVESIKTSCLAQNARHNSVVGAINQQIVIAIVESRNSADVFERATDKDRLRDLAKEAATLDPTKDYKRLQVMADEAKRDLAEPDQALFDKSYAQTFALLNAGAPKQDCDKLAQKVAPPIKAADR